MTGAGGAVAERLPVALPEGLGHPAGHHHSSEREVTAGHALGEGDHVGSEVPALDPEPAPHPPETAYHRVDYEQDPVAGADLGDPREVIAGRRVDPAGADDRLAEEGCDLVRADALDLGLEGRCRVPRNPRAPGDQLAEADPVAFDAGHARAEPVGAVVALVPGDDVGALGLAYGPPVVPSELGGGLDAVPATGTEEHPRVVDGRQARESLGQGGRRLVGVVAEGRVGVEGSGLGGDGVADLPAPVADVGVPEAGGGVEEAATVIAPDPVALGPGEHELRVPHGRHVGERMPQARVGPRRAHEARSAPSTGSSTPLR